MSRKKKHEEHENHERWLVSYADFITLLFAFFTVLYATASTDQSKLEAVIDSMNAVFVGGLPNAMFDGVRGGISNTGLTDTQLTLVSDSTSIARAIRRGLRGSLSDNVVQVGFVNQHLEITIPERIAFAAGRAELHPSAYGVLTDLAAILAPTPAKLQVVGHADGVPVSSGRYADNWDLAAARAVATVRYIEERGVPTEQLTASAEVTRKTNRDARAVTLRLDLDQPALARTLAHELDRRGLISVHE